MFVWILAKLSEASDSETMTKMRKLTMDVREREREKERLCLVGRKMERKLR